MNKANAIYDKDTREVIAMRFGEYWVVPANWGVFGGTIEEVEQCLKDSEDGNVFFIDDLESN